jgi:V-containing nitrogenase delta subunit
MARDMYNAIYSPLMKLAHFDIRNGQVTPANNNGNGKVAKDISEQITSKVQQPVKESTAPVQKQAAVETTPKAEQPVKESTAPVQKQAVETTPKVEQPVKESTAPVEQPPVKAASQVQQQSQEIATYIQERTEEVTALIQQRCLWQFHSRAWDREENINGVLNMAATILTGEKVTLATLLDRAFYADAKLLVIDLEKKFQWLSKMENAQKKAVLDSVKNRLIDIAITNSLNGELHHSLY